MTDGQPQAIAVRQLHPGAVLDVDIYDGNDRLLLRAGTPVSEGMLRQLHNRGILEVQGRSTESASPPPSASPAPEAPSRQTPAPPPLAALFNPDLDRNEAYATGWPDAHQRRHARLDPAALRTQITRGLTHRHALVGQFADQAPALMQNQAINIEQLSTPLLQLRSMIQSDASFGPMILQLQQDPGEYLFNHAVNTAVLTMSLTHAIGFPQNDVFAAGLGAMLHDIGMLRVPTDIRLAPRPLTPVETAWVRQHPTHTVNQIERLRNIPPLTRLVAYQIHERADGRGYPRRRSAMFTHPLARVASLADTYIALTSWRPHRPAIRPHTAIQTLIQQVRRGQFEPEPVRALLDHLSIYPVGSFVQLSDDTPAQVIRATPGHHTRPTVTPLDPLTPLAPHLDPQLANIEIDLTRDDSMNVVSPIDPPHTAAA